MFVDVSKGNFIKSLFQLLLFFDLTHHSKSIIICQSIRLSASAASQTGIGHVVNLMSNDVARLEKALLFGNAIWILPIQSVVVAYLIWRRARWVGVIGVTFLLLTTVPVQTYLGHYRSSLRKKVARRTDKRIEIMNEIVQGIQVIKMYAWQIPFQRVVAEARRLEIQKIRISSYVGSMCGSSCYFVGRVTLFVSIVVLILTEQRLTADIVFSMSQFYHILQVRFLFFSFGFYVCLKSILKSIWISVLFQVKRNYSLPNGLSMWS